MKVLLLLLVLIACVSARAVGFQEDSLPGRDLLSSDAGSLADLLEQGHEGRQLLSYRKLMAPTPYRRKLMAPTPYRRKLMAYGRKLLEQGHEGRQLLGYRKLMAAPTPYRRRLMTVEGNGAAGRRRMIAQ